MITETIQKRMPTDPEVLITEIRRLHARSRQARETMIDEDEGPLFFCNWLNPVFIHYSVDPTVLQRHVPFALDLWKGRAYVSVVAFTLDRLRPAKGGALSAALFKPVATHPLLNVRTYVRHKRGVGIYFMSECVSNRLSLHLGPLLFGLPYRFASLEYQHNHELSNYAGKAESPARKNRYVYEGRVHGETEPMPCPPHSRQAFLFERYTAYTMRRGKALYFKVWHEPWTVQDLDVTIVDESLLRPLGDWVNYASCIGAHAATSLTNVWMGWPHAADHVENFSANPLSW